MKKKKKNFRKRGVIGPLNARERKEKAFQVRYKEAIAQLITRLTNHPCNSDENLYELKIGSFSKGLPHNSLGEVDLQAYNQLIKALKTGDPEDFEGIPLGGKVKLANPQGAYVFDIAGSDCHQLGIPEPPSFSSAWEAGENG